MKNNIKTANYITWSLLFLLLIVLTASIFIGLFNYLGHDEFLRSRAYKNIGYFDQVFKYFIKNGNFSNLLFVSGSAVNDLPTYRYHHIWLMGVMMLSTWLFISSFLKAVLIENSKKLTIAIFSSIIISIIVATPNIGQFWYWYATSTSYMMSLAFYLIILSILLRIYTSEKTNVTWLVILSLLCFLTVGLSDLAMTVLLSTMTLALFVSLLNKQKQIIVPWLFTIVGCLLIAISKTRLSKPDEISPVIQIFKNIQVGLNQLGKISFEAILYWLSSFQIIALVLLTIMVVFIVVDREKIKANIFKIFIISSIFSALLLLSIMIQAIILENKLPLSIPTRLASLAWCLFMVMMVVNSVLLALWIKRTVQIKPQMLVNSLGVVALLIFCVVTYMQQNTQFMISDILNDRGQRQSDGIQNWNEIIQQAKVEENKSIVVPALNSMHTLSHIRTRGITSNPEKRTNKYFIYHHGLNNKEYKVSRANFDKDIRDKLFAEYQSRGTNFNLNYYRDDYRNYLLIQVPFKTKDGNQFCIQMVDNPTYFETTVDEDFFDFKFDRLELNWVSGIHCTTFKSHGLYCDQVNEDYFCRAPMPTNYTGPVDVEWLGEKQRIIVE